MDKTVAKLKFKDTPTVINAPADIHEALVAMGFHIKFNAKEKCANALIFVSSLKELHSILTTQLKYIEADAVLWIAYPKGTSKVKTDIHRDILHTAGEEYGITGVSLVSIDTVWSAMRFRPIEKVGRK
jgi:hypothetical protein